MRAPSMCDFFLLLLCLACICTGRRVQTFIEPKIGSHQSHEGGQHLHKHSNAADTWPSSGSIAEAKRLEGGVERTFNISRGLAGLLLTLNHASAFNPCSLEADSNGKCLHRPSSLRHPPVVAQKLGRIVKTELETGISITADAAKGKQVGRRPEKKHQMWPSRATHAVRKEIDTQSVERTEVSESGPDDMEIDVGSIIKEKDKFIYDAIDAANEDYERAQYEDIEVDVLEDADSKDDEVASLKTRLAEVRVDPALQREVFTMVAYRFNGNFRGKREVLPFLTNPDILGLPLSMPFGTRPKFIATYGRFSAIPPETVPEVCFIGRSNVGKSTLLNAMAGIHSLAKTSDKPGKTQSINFFKLGKEIRPNAIEDPRRSRVDPFLLVDMPGYGFALAKEDAVDGWSRISEEYLRSRLSLKLVLVLIDARHGLKQNDMQLLQFLEANKRKYTIVFTKVDDAGHPKRVAQMVALTMQQIQRARYLIKPIHVLSSRTGAGVGRLQRRVIEVTTGKDPKALQDGGWNEVLKESVKGDDRKMRREWREPRAEMTRRVLSGKKRSK